MEHILVSDDVAGAITAELVNVPWDKAFNALLDMKNYAADIDVAAILLELQPQQHLLLKKVINLLERKQ